MISKELLSEVLKENIVEVYKIGSNPNFKQNTLLFKLYGCGELCSINIYELAHKCKEWALQNNFKIQSGAYTVNTGKIPEIGGYDATIYHFFKFGSICFNSDTETEAIIKACEWILDNKPL